MRGLGATTGHPASHNRSVAKRRFFYLPERLSVFPFDLSRFALAVLPLIILGYIFGTLISASLNGWNVHPLLVVLNGAGILLALQRVRQTV